MTISPYWIRVTEEGEQRVSVREQAYRSGRTFRSRWIVMDRNARGRFISQHDTAAAVHDALTRQGFRPDDRASQSPQERTL